MVPVRRAEHFQRDLEHQRPQPRHVDQIPWPRSRSLELRQSERRAKRRCRPIPTEPDLLVRPQPGVLTMTIRLLRAAAPAALGLAASLMGCANLTVPDLNNSSISDFQSHPSAAGADAIATGLLRGARDGTWFLIRTLGVFGREGYSLNVAQGDLPTYLIGPLSPGDFLVSGTWNQQYADLRAANILLDGLPNVTDLTAPQKEAMTGFVQTMEAFDLSQLAATRDTFGIPIAVDIDPTGALPAIAPKAQVYQHIYNLLDSAQTHLQNGGGVFPFPMPQGFSGFDTPTTFVLFNRALRVRVDITLSDYPHAIADLKNSFI